MVVPLPDLVKQKDFLELSGFLHYEDCTRAVTSGNQCFALNGPKI